VQPRLLALDLAPATNAQLRHRRSGRPTRSTQTGAPMHVEEVLTDRGVPALLVAAFLQWGESASRTAATARSAPAAMTPSQACWSPKRRDQERRYAKRMAPRGNRQPPITAATGVGLALLRENRQCFSPSSTAGKSGSARHGRYTNRWRNLAHAAIRRAGACQDCGRTEDLTAHLDPAFAGDHNSCTIDDLTTLCRRCHGRRDGRRAHARHARRST
jgi:5-methylcytosine-specific restriction endonuclease McrA